MMAVKVTVVIELKLVVDEMTGVEEMVSLDIVLVIDGRVIVRKWWQCL